MGTVCPHSFHLEGTKMEKTTMLGYSGEWARMLLLLLLLFGGSIAFCVSKSTQPSSGFGTALPEAMQLHAPGAGSPESSLSWNPTQREISDEMIDCLPDSAPTAFYSGDRRRTRESTGPTQKAGAGIPTSPGPGSRHFSSSEDPGGTCCLIAGWKSYPCDLGEEDLLAFFRTGKTTWSMLGNSSSRSLNSTDSRLAFAGEVCQLLLMVFLIIAITLGNLVSLLVFFRVRQFRRPQSYLKASLALADLAVGLFVVPYSVYQEVIMLAYGTEQEMSQASKSACFITGPVFAGCTFVSISTIFLLSVERSIAVLKPLHRKAVITKRRIIWLILASWMLSFSLAVIPLLSISDITFAYNSCSKMCNYGFPPDKLPKSSWNVMLLYPIFDFSLLGGTFAVNSVTFATLRQNCKTRKQLGEEAQRNYRLTFSEVAAAKTIGILTFAFSVSFLPIAVFVVGTVVGYEWCQFSFYAFWILTSNSCWNVAIYSIWDPKFRQGVREVFCKQTLITSQQHLNHSLEGHSSAPACVIVLKEMLRPETS